MKVITPGEAARYSDNKYLGILVAAQFARNLNALRRGEMFEPDQPLPQREKLTTTALEAVSLGAIPYRLVDRSGGDY